MSEPTFDSTRGGSPWCVLATDYKPWILSGIFLAFSIWLVNDCLLYTPDSARYLIWAKSLASFHGFTDASAPEATRYVVHAPLYPLLLAPLAWLFDNIVIPSKILTMGMMALLVLLFYAWTCPRTGSRVALIAAFLLAFNGLTIVLSSQVLSDVPFALALVLLVLLAQKIEEDPHNHSAAWAYAAVLTAAILLREVGLTLLVASAVYFFLRKRYFALLLVCLMPIAFYLLWYYRNEISVAGMENPPLRNSRLLLRNSLTAEDASFLEEIFARLRVNSIVYAKMAKGLFLFPLFLTRSFPVVWEQDAVMQMTSMTLVYAQVPLILLQYGLLAWGIVIRRRDPQSLLLGLFFLLYNGLVLMYPINDIRFFFPFLPPALMFAAAGAKDLYDRFLMRWPTGFAIRPVLLTLLAFCMLPTFVWLSDFTLHARTYRHRTAAPGVAYEAQSMTPELYVRPASIVGNWISRHSDSSSVILARWKELSFWVEGRKVMDSEPTISFSLFDAVLRDYEIDFIVNYVMNPGIREFEFQMLKSKKYEFRPVFRAGNFEVVQVIDREKVALLALGETGRDAELPAVPIQEREATSRELFAEGVRTLEGHRERDAFYTFGLLTEMSRGSAYLALFRGIALSFGGHYNSALSYFSRFAYEQQAGQFLMEARFHSVLIHEFEKADRDSLPESKAGVLHRISANYWDRGFHEWAQVVLKRSLEADPSFTPSMIFGVYYALEQDDLPEARRYLSMVENIKPPHPMLGPVHRILTLADSVRIVKRIDLRLSYEMELSRSFAAIGLNDLAIEHALKVVALDHQTADALTILAQSYELKRRYWPAVQALRKLVALSPEDRKVAAKLSELEVYL